MRGLSNIFEKYIPDSAQGSQWPQVVALNIACFVCVNFGLLYTWTSPYIPYLISNSSHIPFTFEETPYLTMLSQTATIISGPIFCATIDLVGRREAIMFISLPYLASWIMINRANSHLLLYGSRIASGIGDAACFTAIPIYMGEIAEPSVRGTWGNIFTINIYIGQLLINVFGSFLTMRISAIVFMFMPIVHIIACMLLPESPSYLILRGKKEKAMASLRTLRWKQDVQKEFNMLEEMVLSQSSESFGLLEFIKSKSNRKACLITVGNRLVQCLSGLQPLAFYTQYIFLKAGGNISRETSAILFSATMVISVTVFGFMLEKIGRRPAMIISSTVCSIALTIEALYFYADQYQVIDTSVIKWVPLASLLTYVVGCCSGLALVPSLMLSELFPAKAKGKAMCMNNIVFAGAAIFGTKLFQSLTSSFGLFVPFTFFAFCTAISIVYSYTYVIETKGRTLAEIQDILKS